MTFNKATIPQSSLVNLAVNHESFHEYSFSIVITKDFPLECFAVLVCNRLVIVIVIVINY